MPFEDFYLTVNEQGLPFTHTEANDNTFKDNEFKDEKDSVPNTAPKDAFDTDDTDDGILF